MPAPPNTLVNNCNSLQSKHKYRMSVCNLFIIYFSTSQQAAGGERCCMFFSSVNTHTLATWAHWDKHILSQMQLSELESYGWFPLTLTPNLNCRIYSDEEEYINSNSLTESVSCNITPIYSKLNLIFIVLAIIDVTFDGRMSYECGKIISYPWPLIFTWEMGHASKRLSLLTWVLLKSKILIFLKWAYSNNPVMHCDKF